jgi:uncharacterized protein YkvS
MKIKFLLSAVYTFAFLIIVTSCGSNKEKDIIGVWKDSNGNIIEFRKDGVVTGITKDVNKQPVEGSYKVKDDSLLIDFIVATEPEEIKGNLDFLIHKLDTDSLILNTDLGNLNYWRMNQ